MHNACTSPVSSAADPLSSAEGFVLARLLGRSIATPLEALGALAARRLLAEHTIDGVVEVAPEPLQTVPHAMPTKLSVQHIDWLKKNFDDGPGAWTKEDLETIGKADLGLDPVPTAEQLSTTGRPTMPRQHAEWLRKMGVDPHDLSDAELRDVVAAQIG